MTKLALAFIRFSVPFVACALAGMAQAAFASPAEGFDKPLQVQTKRLKADPEYPGEKHVASCYSYPGYMVKQLDFGEVGAERLSIIALAAGANASCDQSKAPGEYVIPPETWSGYFAGAKGGYAFFNADDGVNDGMGFIVLRVEDKKKIFEDVREKSFHSMELHDGVPLVRYRRVYSASCSVPVDGASCIDAIVRDTGVSKASLGLCAQGYRQAEESLARERCKAQSKTTGSCMTQEMALLHKQKWDASPSVISYEVELDLHEIAAKDKPLPAAQIKPLGDALACRPAD